MRASVGVAVLLSAVVAPAEPGGTYAIDGGGYTIDLKMDGDTLVVVEPNKTSPYARQADGTYQFTNPNNGITYGIRVIDDRTIEAFKPGTDNPPTRLSLMGGAPSGEEPAAVADAEKWEALAQHYSELSQSDPDNVQVNTACAGVALKRSASSQAEADAYAAQMAEMLKQILVDGSSNPCPDVFTSW
ncbi:hypothetical protein [Sphingomonas hankyongi]|uniref:Secreted protein n=1 Tax=Sphingomonas hankyongi TaxID=2908209 RepID=A0ABT0S2S5_9SPHN|nr:hypothetical protein [Sphingomonas hankyongi]MCL6730046.1 hypothetical protein [Sphingomonas hankyongi]